MPCNCGGSKQFTPPAEQSAATTRVRGAASPGYFAPKTQERPVWNGPKPKAS